MAYDVLVAALEEGLGNTVRHALDVLKRFSAPAGVLGEQWLIEQERKIGACGKKIGPGEEDRLAQGATAQTV